MNSTNSIVNRYLIDTMLEQLDINTQNVFLSLIGSLTVFDRHFEKIVIHYTTETPYTPSNSIADLTLTHCHNKKEEIIKEIFTFMNDIIIKLDTVTRLATNNVTPEAVPNPGVNPDTITQDNKYLKKIILEYTKLVQIDVFNINNIKANINGLHTISKLIPNHLWMTNKEQLNDPNHKINLIIKGLNLQLNMEKNPVIQFKIAHELTSIGLFNALHISKQSFTSTVETINNKEERINQLFINRMNKILQLKYTPPIDLNRNN